MRVPAHLRVLDGGAVEGRGYRTTRSAGARHRTWRADRTLRSALVYYAAELGFWGLVAVGFVVVVLNFAVLGSDR